MNNLLKSIILMLLTTGSVMASSLPNFPFLLVTGEAKIEVSPNIAHINLNLMTFDVDPENALVTIGSRGRDIVELLNKLEVKKSDIKSYNLNKQTRRERSNNVGQGKISGYEISQRFEIALRNIKHYSLVMDQLIAMKNVSNVNINFDVTNRDELVQSLVRSAGKDAKRKAKDLAAGLDTQLGRVFAATQDSSFNEFFARFGLRQENMGRVSAMKMSDRAGKYNMFAPETIELRKSINVVYRLL
jgi:uncharacterized protein YggE